MVIITRDGIEKPCTPPCVYTPNLVLMTAFPRNEQSQKLGTNRDETATKTGTKPVHATYEHLISLCPKNAQRLQLHLSHGGGLEEYILEFWRHPSKGREIM